MKRYQLACGLEISRIAYGCMHLDQIEHVEERERVIGTAMDQGINFFDHADIYGAGACETLFGELLKRNPTWRKQIVLQSKCGVRFGGDTCGEAGPSRPRYDSSYEHILRATEGILSRLQIEQLDILQLHRPDLLMQPDELARAFDVLHKSGKVAHFGVSNFDAARIRLLQQSLNQPLIANQVQLSLLHAGLIAQAAKFNLPQESESGAGTLDFCRSEGMLLQAWSPLARGQLFTPPHDAPHHIHQAAALIYELAEKKSTNPSAIVLGWLLRHPAGIQPVIGTTNVDRIEHSAEADSLDLSREEWYELLERAQGQAVP